MQGAHVATAGDDQPHARWDRAGLRSPAGAGRLACERSSACDGGLPARSLPGGLAGLSGVHGLPDILSYESF